MPNLVNMHGFGSLYSNIEKKSIHLVNNKVLTIWMHKYEGAYYMHASKSYQSFANFHHAKAHRYKHLLTFSNM